MEKSIKERMLQLLTTLQEAHQEIEHVLSEKEYEAVGNLLEDCQNGAILIGNTIERFEEKQEHIIGILEEYCETLFRINMALEGQGLLDGSKVKSELDQYIQDVSSRIKDIKVLKIVFFPYKASMWTSLESIWRAAEKDRECEVKVVVIPYYTLDEAGNEDEFKYEAELFPEDVPIVHYREYSVEQELPDMVFIHNPYDGRNNVTRIPKEYYSYRLKLFTKQLIYSPYCLQGYYSPKDGNFLCLTNGAHIADKVLLQSERLRQIYIDHRINEEKLLALGSPKVDSIVDGMRKPAQYPAGWSEKLAGRKVFLLNTHLFYFIIGDDYQKGHPGSSNYAQRYHEQIFQYLLGKEGCALIWRPHPLLKAALKSRGLYASLEFVEKWEQRVRESENGVIDENGEYNTSFILSDALITTHSTMIADYMITGKPIYIWENYLNEENCKNSPVDYRHNYFKGESGKGKTFYDFVQMVLEGEDPLYDGRMQDVRNAFDNLEGTIGQNIYDYLKGNFGGKDL